MKRTLQNLSVATLILSSTFANAQNVGINATGVAPSGDAMLDIASTNKGLLIPRVNIANLTNIAPVTGGSTTSLLVYNTNATTGQGYYYWNGSAWVNLSGDDWKITGNAGTVAGTNFLGTTDAQALDFRTNNTTRFRILNGFQIQSFGNGSAGSPVYSRSSDPNTGMYFSAADQLSWSTAGGEELRLRNTYLRVGFNGTETVPAYSFLSDPNTGMWHDATDELNLGAGGVEFITLDEGGTDVLIFNEDSDNNFDVRMESATNSNMFFLDGSNDVIGFSGAPSAPYVLGAGIPVHTISYPIEIGNDGNIGSQVTIGYFRSSDPQVNPEQAGGWGYVGYSVGASNDYWWRMYAGGFINVSERSLKKNIHPISDDTEMDNYIVNSILNMKPSFYNYKNEYDEMIENKENHYRPAFRIGLIADETPDYILDEGFSGVDIYGLATLSLAGVQHNMKEIQKIKNQKRIIQDFGSQNLKKIEVWVSFTEDFKGKIPIITLTSNNPNIVLSIVEKTDLGFKVISSGTASNLNFDWIAMAKVSSAEEKKTITSDLPSNIKDKLEIPSSEKAQIIEYYKNLKSTITPNGKQ